MKKNKSLYLTAKEKIELLSKGESVPVRTSFSNNKRNYVVKLRGGIYDGLLKKGISL